MDESLQCGGCGIWVHCFLRYCPQCGEPLFIALDPVNAKPENFFDLMTSLYNLVANQDNRRRSRYLPGISERVIQRRCEVEFRDEAHAFGFNSDDKDWPEEVRDVFAMALTNTLIGYIYRSVEEFICHAGDVKSGGLTVAETEALVSYFISGETGYNESCFRELNPEDEIDWRVLFCLALRINENYVRYLLEEKDLHDEWFQSILGQSIEKTIFYYSIAFRALCPDNDLRQFLAMRKGFIQENVEKDFLFGYIVKLSESLLPIKAYGTAHLH
ncbi:MAG: hypothetical protein CSYNP_01069 [Syntrophus sp. SKADARSKE-3]|nr:hypothetical protein [Syntrophus sp. SKADARSKE-3]